MMQLSCNIFIQYFYAYIHIIINFLNECNNIRGEDINIMSFERCLEGCGHFFVSGILGIMQSRLSILCSWLPRKGQGRFGAFVLWVHGKYSRYRCGYKFSQLFRTVKVPRINSDVYVLVFPYLNFLSLVFHVCQGTFICSSSSINIFRH